MGTIPIFDNFILSFNVFKGLICSICKSVHTYEPFEITCVARFMARDLLVFSKSYIIK